MKYLKYYFLVKLLEYFFKNVYVNVYTLVPTIQTMTNIILYHFLDVKIEFHFIYTMVGILLCRSTTVFIFDFNTTFH